MSSTHERRLYTYAHPHPAVATDIAIFTLLGERLAVMLIKRGETPYKGRWALPGGFLRPKEDLDACARRELFEETGVEVPLLRHFGNFSSPNRDPRGRVISVAYLALLRSHQVALAAGTDASAAEWFEISRKPPLAFDHETIVHVAIDSLRALIEREDVLMALLPDRFTLSQFQATYEAVADQSIDKRNFRSKVRDKFLATGLIVETGDSARGAHRPAKIYARA